MSSTSDATNSKGLEDLDHDNVYGENEFFTSAFNDKANRPTRYKGQSLYEHDNGEEDSSRRSSRQSKYAVYMNQRLSPVAATLKDTYESSSAHEKYDKPDDNRINDNDKSEIEILDAHQSPVRNDVTRPASVRLSGGSVRPLSTRLVDDSSPFNHRYSGTVKPQSLSLMEEGEHVLLQKVVNEDSNIQRSVISQETIQTTFTPLEMKSRNIAISTLANVHIFAVASGKDLCDGLSSAAADALYEVLEVLRTKSPTIFWSLRGEMNEARISVCSHVRFSEKEMAKDVSSRRLAKMPWLPRVVEVTTHCCCEIGSTVDLGLTQRSTLDVGFTLELWVRLETGQKDVFDSQDTRHGGWGTSVAEPHRGAFCILLVSDSCRRGLRTSTALGKAPSGSPFRTPKQADPSGTTPMHPLLSIVNGCVAISTGSTASSNVSSEEVVRRGEWTHIAAVFGPGSVSAFVNGAQVISDRGKGVCMWRHLDWEQAVLLLGPPTALRLPSRASLRLSVNKGGVTSSGTVSAGHASVEGELTEVRLWLGQRTREDILQHMNRAISPAESVITPGLRLAWLPVSRSTLPSPPRANGTVQFIEPALFFDPWTRCALPGRKGDGSPSELDCRWPSVLPKPLVAVVSSDPIRTPDFDSDRRNLLELAAIQEARNLPFALNDDYENQVKDVLRLVAAEEPAVIADSEGDLTGSSTDLPPRVVRIRGGGDPAGENRAFVGMSDDLGIASRNGFTVECWLRFPQSETSSQTGRPTKPWFRVLGAVDDGLCGQVLQLLVCPHSVRMDFGDGQSALSCDLPAGGNVRPQDWNHLAFVYREGRKKIFINGHAVGKRSSSYLRGSCSLYTGGFVGLSAAEDVVDVCELRVWSRGLGRPELKRLKKFAMPAGLRPLRSEDLAGQAEFQDLLEGSISSGLRLSWLPLRYGGPRSLAVWLNAAQQGQLTNRCRPQVTLLWDRLRAWDSGRLCSSDTNILISRYTLLPPSGLTKQSTVTGSASALLLDEWTDRLDSQIKPQTLWTWLRPENGSQEVSPESRCNCWVPRVLLLRRDSSASGFAIGSAADLGLVGAWTVELWVRLSCRIKGVFEVLGQPPSDRSMHIGLSDNHPFVCFGHSSPDGGATVGGALVDQVMSTENSDKQLVSEVALVPFVWTHVSFVMKHTGLVRVLMNGTETCRSTLSGKLDDVESPLTVFKSQLLGSASIGESPIAVCEFRLWGLARSDAEILDTMAASLAPLPGRSLPIPSPRLLWLPLQRSCSLLWDLAQNSPRGDRVPDSSSATLVSLTRSPLILPPLLAPPMDFDPCDALYDSSQDTFEASVMPFLRFHSGRLFASGADVTHLIPSMTPLMDLEALL